jgi:hypothetical protein
MKKNLFAVIAGVLIFAGIPSATSCKNDSKAAIYADTPPIAPGDLFTLADALKILGENAHLSDSSTSLQKDVVNYHYTYTANAADSKSKKTGNIYYLLEDYSYVSLAEKKYSSIKKANQDHGIKTLHDLGDEAYFHSDNENFYFIMVRKGPKVLTMKVNKITSNTSLDEFNRVAREITAGL